jgi:hypothetical protein
MNTVFRTHVKDTTRLELFERSLASWYDKGLDQLGNLYIVDDQSPMQDEVVDLAIKYKALYTRTHGHPDMKNSLYESLNVQKEYPVLCCVDDMVFGKGVLERIRQIEQVDIPALKMYSTIGLFACYQKPTRDELKIRGLDLWQIPHALLYALVAHIYSAEIVRIYSEVWEEVLKGTIPAPEMCDDIFVKILSMRSSLQCYNTYKDYAQHTGMGNRTFTTPEDDKNGINGIGSSNYTSLDFVGE